MTEEECVTFGRSGWGSVWSVDDAWFDGYEGAFSIAQEISLFGLDRDYEGILSAIAKRVQARSEAGEIKLQLELEYLEVLARLCKENNLYLNLCSFEYFEKNYHDEMNKEKTAILLDIKYDNFRRSDKKSALTCEPYTSNNYGYLLLGDVMNGERSRADIFFVTSHSEHFNELTSFQKTEPLWWPMRTIPFVRKFSLGVTREETLENELGLFIRYFRQGVEKDPRREFSNALFRAEAFSHPSDIETDVPIGFLLREEFIGVGGSEDECESFKALYMLDQRPDGKGDRELRTRIFSAHLEYAGVKVEVDGAESFKLPVEPGMLFILCLVDLHRSLHLSEPIRLEVRNGDEKGNAQMMIPLKDPEDFKHVFFTRESGEGAVNALRRLLGCKPKVFQSYVDADRDEVSPLITRWENGRKTRSGRHYKQVMKHSIDRNRITLTWEYDSRPPRPNF